MPPSTWSRILRTLETAEDRLGRHAAFLTGWLALLWALEAGDQLGHWNLDRFGIQPRTAPGLVGIVTAPFLHHGYDHLAANSISLMALAWLTLLSGEKRFGIVSAMVILGSGTSVWLTGHAGSLHFGCSALIFGYLGYLLLYGLRLRSWAWIAVSATVGLAYGSMALRALPGTDTDLSWEGHFFGFLFGLFGALAAQRAEPARPS